MNLILGSYFNTHLSWLTHPQPLASEGGNLGHDTQHALLTSVHCLCLDVTKPDFETRREVLPRQLQHRNVTTSIELKIKFHNEHNSQTKFKGGIHKKKTFDM